MQKQRFAFLEANDSSAAVVQICVQRLRQLRDGGGGNRLMLATIPQQVLTANYVLAL